MIRIITGEKDSGKSTKFMRLYQEEGHNAPGLYTKKLYEGNTICGYNLVLLPTLDEYQFIMLNSGLEINPDRHYIQGHFVFLKEVFNIGKKHILSFPRNSQVWIDEVGSLEVNGNGYDFLLQTIFSSNRAITFTVRDYWVAKILEKYKITEFRLEKLKDEITSYNGH